jgi:hypothetical protein
MLCDFFSLFFVTLLVFYEVFVISCTSVKVGI